MIRRPVVKMNHGENVNVAIAVHVTYREVFRRCDPKVSELSNEFGEPEISPSIDVGMPPKFDLVAHD